MSCLIYHVIIYSFVKWLHTVVLSIRTYKSQKCCAAYVIPHVTHHFIASCQGRVMWKPQLHLFLDYFGLPEGLSRRELF